MPTCLNCTKFNPENKICSVPDGSPIRKCIITSLEKHLSPIQNQTICEIGCGAWSFAKDIVEKNNCTWLGIDPLEYDSMGRKTIRTHPGTANSIPLPSNHVDVVLATQSLEHWYEYRTTFKSGFSEMHRILKPGGILIMNFPIHLHGHSIFLKGNINKIKHLWSPYLWTKIHFEEWRKDYQPLEVYQGWKLIRDNKNIIGKHDEDTSTWIMDVVATKIDASSKRGAFMYHFSILMLDLKPSLLNIMYKLIKMLPGSKSIYKRLKNLINKN
ncbi:MAG: class I SAM-dependent methyltransferase [SAR202 cluster bacterium]|nr:class I SAM-dependent methyltransferase [SAR202 cluster bacterium]|tara:strand:+ start:6615 stop:7424 length:810 start_codon:yes stop_codon:yes gene_type:complete